MTISLFGSHTQVYAEAKLFYGYFEEAISLHKRLLEVLRNIDERKNHYIAAESLHHLGYATGELKRIEEAQDIYLRVIAMMEAERRISICAQSSTYLVQTSNEAIYPSTS